MTDYIARLRAAIAPIANPESWDGDETFGVYPDPTRNLLRVRPLARHLVEMLQRIDDTGAAWTVSHILRRIYKSAVMSMPTITPFLSQMRRQKRGGQRMYWAVSA